ncbi:hypothetical protein GNI_176320 [Gregarina niphandrodes]|uniref:Uncharacterized protein n=1 Tax=Gregarina niphandrodes TaxID=110365 RepID=A0A023AY11_GRENI|nr:hypothetical protein GNI_176320 [Gregarina niphandrodes]EZG43338.1 hypothetical protein GNI_176320 [Gregarina niphandrodes]|eukprot:XP_011133409.1 hypothetical protein GNI_176320 [Gregarina niphandrodes]
MPRCMKSRDSSTPLGGALLGSIVIGTRDHSVRMLGYEVDLLNFLEAGHSEESYSLPVDSEGLVQIHSIPKLHYWPSISPTLRKCLSMEGRAKNYDNAVISPCTAPDAMNQLKIVNENGEELYGIGEEVREIYPKNRYTLVFGELPFDTLKQLLKIPDSEGSQGPVGETDV